MSAIGRRSGQVHGIFDEIAGSLATAALPVATKQIEVRSNFLPPAIVNVEQATSGAPGPPNPVGSFVRPTIILSGGQLGKQVIAPWGQASPNAWKLNLFLVGLAGAIAGGIFTFTVFGLGRKTQRRRGR